MDESKDDLIIKAWKETKNDKDFQDTNTVRKTIFIIKLNVFSSTHQLIMLTY